VVRALKNLPEKTYGHINSAFCDGMATTVTAAHHFIWRHLCTSLQAAQTPASKLRFVTPDKESSMNTLWQEEEFGQICSRESLTAKAVDIASSWGFQPAATGEFFVELRSIKVSHVLLCLWLVPSYLTCLL